MAEIIPSINAATFDEVQKRIALVEPYVSWVHLDVTDGVFSRHPTWRDPADLPRLRTKLKAEAHLMVEKPENVIEQWLVPPVRRVIVHVGTMLNTECSTCIQKCHDAGIEIGFAIKSDTPVSVLDPWLGKVDMVVLLRVPPGASGQKMPSERLEEIRHLRAACPGCTIEVDGGVNSETAARADGAGANLMVAGAAIFNAADIGQAITGLTR